MSDVYLNATKGYGNLGNDTLSPVNNGSQIVEAASPYYRAYQFNGGKNIAVDNAAINGDFTIEFFFMLNASWSNGYSRILMSFGTAQDNTDGFGIEVFKNSSGMHCWFRQSYSGISGLGAVVVGQWYHVVVQRSADQWSIGLDGALGQFSPSDPSRDLATPRTMWIGYGRGSWVQYPEMLISDFSMQDSARYSAAFTPQYPSRDVILPGAGIGMPIKRSDVMNSWEGTHRISGAVRLEASPASNRPVYLLEPRGMRVIAKTVAGADGKYAFRYIKQGQYLVMGRDPETHYHPDIARVQSEPM